MDNKQEDDGEMLDYMKLSEDSKDLRKSSVDYSELRHKLEMRLHEMDTERSPWVQQWSDLATYIKPQFGAFIQQTTQTQKGAKSKKEILDNTPLFALRTCAAGMLGSLSSPTKPWFRLSSPKDAKDNRNIKDWLAESDERLRAGMHKASLYGAFFSMYFDAILFGTSVMIVHEDHHNIARIETIPIGQYYLGSDHTSEINTLMRKFNMTVYQIVDRFGLDNVSDRVRQAWDNKNGLHLEVTVIQAIFPNKDYNPQGKGKEKWEYCDVTWEEGQNNGKLLEYRGFREKPFFALRWSTLTGTEVYGESPAMDALPDIKMLQKLTKEKLTAAGKIVSPPLLAPTSLKDQPAMLIPNGITYTADVVGGRMAPVYEVPYQIMSILQNDIDIVSRRIAEAFYRNLWMLLDSLEGVQPRSQMELTQRQGERILGLSPTLQKIQAELHEGVIDRFFSIMFLRGLLPEPPPEVVEMFAQAENDLKVEYISDLLVAQNAKDTIPIEQLFALVGNLAGVHPEVLDKIDFDKGVEQYGDALNVPSSLIRATDKADGIRQARQKQAQQQQMMEQGLAMTQGAKNLSETQVGGGMNALAMMTGGGM